MITMEIISEFLGVDTDKGAWEYFFNHWRFLFPAIGSRSNFAKQAANLWIMKQQIQKKLATELGGFHDTLHLVLCLFAILDERISVKSLPVKPHMGIALLKVRYIMASKVIY